MSALEFCYRLLNEGHVLIFPGNPFGEKWTDWLRVSYLQDESALQEVLARITRVLGQGSEQNGYSRIETPSHSGN